MSNQDYAGTPLTEPPEQVAQRIKTFEEIKQQLEELDPVDDDTFVAIVTTNAEAISAFGHMLPLMGKRLCQLLKQTVEMSKASPELYMATTQAIYTALNDAPTEAQDDEQHSESRISDG